VAAGFLAPLFVLGLSGNAGTQAGFRTPLPVFPAGANVGVQAGFRTALPFFPAGAGLPVEPTAERNKGSGTPKWLHTHQARILREDEDILAVIMAFMELRQ